MTFGCKKVLPFQPIENKTASSQTKQIPFWLWFFIRAADDVFLNNAAAPCAPSLMPTRFPFKWRLLQRNVSSLHLLLLFFSLKSHLKSLKGQWVEPWHLKGPLKRVLFWLWLNLNYPGKLGEKACIRLCKDSRFNTLDWDLLKRANFFDNLSPLSKFELL